MHGIATSLDDFGTGYSSLTSLEQLPLTRVKLDRKVVAEVDTNPRSAAIAASIVVLCRSLDLQVTIEGVERPSQLEFVPAGGDVSVQGFLIAAPMDASEILGTVEGMRERLGRLLAAVEQGRVDRQETGSDSTVRRLRRRPRPSEGQDAN
jgi:EAL domain-containing protein (putative c-di-GMP-specific phosphodiesterase class I)